MWFLKNNKLIASCKHYSASIELLINENPFPSPPKDTVHYSICNWYMFKFTFPFTSYQIMEFITEL